MSLKPGWAIQGARPTKHREGQVSKTPTWKFMEGKRLTNLSLNEKTTKQNKTKNPTQPRKDKTKREKHDGRSLPQA